MYRNYYIQLKEEYQNKKHCVRNRILALVVVGVLGVAGCVRLPNDAADFIYENVSKDTHVLIKK